MKCWICESEMKFKKIKKMNIGMTRDFAEYECLKCGEVAYVNQPETLTKKENKI